jgi:hypothetical protein
MSTVNNGPQIVTNGLVLNLDASSRKSYPAIEALIVAGGGSGGVDNGGGGGGGGVISTALNISVNTAYSIVVGAGGAARLGSSDDGPGNNGGNSTAFGYTAIGGSGGTGWVNTTLPPGSATYSGGSGAGQSTSTSGGNSRGAGTGTSGQGFNGGTSVAAYAGGGGGAGGPGGNATSGNVGAGGEGLYVGNLFGYSVGVDGYVAGGGAGGFDVISGYSSTLPFTRNGTVKKLTQTAEDACPSNSGAGGNGGNHNNNTSGAGGSGVVFVRYFGPQRATGGTIYSFNGYTIHRFDSNGTFTLTSGDTTTWYDLSGNSNNGTLTNGPTFSANNKGNILFDGVDDSVLITNNATLRPSTELTIEYVIKGSTPAGWNPIIGYGNGDYTNGNYLCWVETGGALNSLCRINNSGTVTEYRQYSGIGISSTALKCMSFTMRIGDSIRSYYNGVDTNTPTVLPSGGSFYYGGTTSAYQISGAGGAWLNGNIYYMRLYNRALTATEVMQNYQATKTRFGL